MIYKIRRKVDGTCYSGSGDVWNEDGKLIHGYDAVLGSLRHLSGNFGYKNEDTEIVSYNLVIDKITDTPEWSKYYKEIEMQERKRVHTKGDFLYAVIMANMEKVISDIYLECVDGWYDVQDIINKTRLTENDIIEIVHEYLYRQPRQNNPEKFNFKQVFKFNNNDRTKIGLTTFINSMGTEKAKTIMENSLTFSIDMI